MTGSLAGRVALVTGGGKGVGASISRRLAEKGAEVLVNCFHSPDSAKALVAEITRAGGSASMIRASVARRASAEEMFTWIGERFGYLDILVNNAARGVLASMKTTPDSDWDRTLAVNLHGVRWCCELAAPLMAGRPAPAIVNLSSIGASHVMANYAALGVSKAAVEALTRYLAVELAPAGIRVNAASAGLLGNEVASRFPEARAMQSVVVGATPLRRLGREEDLANLVAFLASDEAGFLTGQTLLADGGLSLAHRSLAPPHPAPSGTTVREDESEQAVAADPRTARQVAVVGTGLVVPGAADTDEFWELLRAPRNVFTEPGQRYRLEDFWDDDPTRPDRTYSRVAGYRHDARDPVVAQDVHWLRRATSQALQGVRAHPPEQAAAWVGAWPGGSQDLIETVVASAVAELLGDDGGQERSVRALRAALPRAVERSSEALPHARIAAALSAHVARPDDVLVVDAACASSLTAVDLGARALLDGRCTIAYCGGVESLDPTATVMFSKLRGLSPTGTVASFDAAADGTLFSDGAVMVVLKRLDRALSDGDTVLGVLTGFGASADGKGRSIAAPNPEGQRRAIERARSVNRNRRRSLDWTVAHATGTKAGDAAELSALARLAPSGGQICTSSKAVVGHTGWAAGGVSLAHALLGLAHGTVPPQHGHTRPPADAELGALRIPTQETPLPAGPGSARTVGVSAFGFGGANAHLLVGDRDGSAGFDSAPPVVTAPVVLVAWSAHLPGGHDRAQIRSWLLGQGPAPGRSFGLPYPLPTPAVTRIAPRTAAAIDPTHLMALETADRFARENGPLWEAYRETTGIIGAHTGVPHVLVETAVRCYGPTLRRLPDARAAAAAARRVEAAARAVPACSEDTQPGVMPNVMASRIAHLWDVHGLTMTVDQGVRSAHAAVDTAAGLLRRGCLDLAFVLACDGPATAVAAALAEADPQALAEGAVLLAFARADTAHEAGWPVLAELDDLLQATPTEAGPSGPRRPVTQRALALVAVAERTGARPAAGPEADEPPPRPPAPGIGTHRSRTSPRPTSRTTPRPTMRTRRHLPVLLPSPLPPEVPDAATPSGATVLYGSPADLSWLKDVTAGIDHLTFTVSANGPAAHRYHRLTDPGERHRLAQRLKGRPPHLRLVLDARTLGMGDAHRLHDLLFTAARFLFRSAGPGSLGILVAHGADAQGLNPQAALFAGFAQALALEQPGLSCRSLVTDGPVGPPAWKSLERELACSWDTTVLLLDGFRHTEALYPAPLPDADPRRLPLTEASTVVATGGAGGVVSTMLEALAAHVTPRLWIMGTSLPEALPADLDTTDPAARRRALIARAHDKGSTLRDAVAEADRAVSAATAHANLGRLRAVFGDDRVTYIPCDLTDSEQVTRAMARIIEATGGIDLLVHGAGRSRPGLLPGKSLDDFMRVRDPKTFGLLHLQAAVQHNPPRLWCLIGSLAGSAGMPGDTDYSAANAFLGAHPRHRGQRPDTGSISVGFPLWGQSGLGSGDLTSHFLNDQAVLTAVSDAEGSRHFLAELAGHRAHGPAGVYLGDKEYRYFTPRRPHWLRGARGPRLRQEIPGDGETARWECVWTPAADGFLHDHLVDGKPTVPGTFLLDIAGQAAQALLPSMNVSGFTDSDFAAFVRPFGARTPLALRIEATPRPDLADVLVPGSTAIGVTLTSLPPLQPRGGARRPRRHFSTTVHLTPRERPTPPGTDLPVSHTPTLPDPYHHTASPVLLRGIFANTSEGRHEGAHASSRWSLPADSDPRPVVGSVTPALALCALLRTAALPMVPGERQEVFVPRRIGRIDLYGTARNDLELMAAHPGGLALRGDLAANRFTAATSEGHVVITVEGSERVRVGTVRAVMRPEATSAVL
ncbi:SDR family oxidoreductase [Streptomyces zhihengii]